MKYKRGKIIIILGIIFLSLSKTNFVKASSVASKLKGMILLQVEDKGQAWYVDPQKEERIYLGKPNDAFKVMKEMGTGISNANLNKIAAGSEKNKNLNLAKRLAGKILLQVESSGQAWYINPKNYKRYFLGRPSDAFKVMRELGSGISNKDLNQIKIKKSFSTPQSTLAQISHPIADLSSYITGLITNAKGEPVSRDLVIWIKENPSKKIISYYPTTRGEIDFEKVDNGQYTLEIWERADLEDPEINAEPSYSLNFDFKGEKIDLKLILPEPERELTNTTTINDTEIHLCNGQKYAPCGQGLIFYCLPPNQAQCRKIPKNKLEINNSELERQIYALINYKRRQGKIYALKWDNRIANFSKKHSEEMAKNNYVDLKDEECDLFCRFNQDSSLHSDSAENIAIRSIYKSIYSDGVISEYLSQFAIADFIVNGWAQDAENKKIIFSRDHESQGVGIKINKNKIYVTNDLTTFLNSDEENELKKITLSLITKDDDERAKIQKVHNWITNNIAYDAENFASGNIPALSYTAAGAFRNRIAVCQGYAELMRLMLRYLNINSEVIGGRGYSNNKYGDHGWNKVVLNGENLYIDATWDAGYAKEGKFTRQPEETYLLILKVCMDVDHIGKGEKEKTLEEQKKYVNDNLKIFSEKCPALKNEILSKK